MVSTITIEEQVRVIRRATAKATKTKEKALQFLQDAGIVAKESAKKSAKTGRKRN